MISEAGNTREAAPLYFKMEAKLDGYYQTAVVGLSPGHPQKGSKGRDASIASERMDIVVGSGVRGQSYLYWHGDLLYELPVSYWSDSRRWINSPGYGNGTMDFSRPIYPRCLECHASYIEPRLPGPLTNRYYKESLVTGISCESCHGPGAEHVALQQENSPDADLTGRAILNPAKFSRDRQVDLCALCHSGTHYEEIRPAFSFLPGKQLDDYLRSDNRDVDEHPNLHANQVGLLEKSRCYLSSKEMSCSTCHNTHAPEQSTASYSARCLSCHKVRECGMSSTVGPKIAEDCIDCHMPVEPTSAIFSETANQLFRPKMRNHWIKVYALSAAK
ncbi:MAG: multiheme c-type cytochrome [Acidobacteriaceae bacterium]